MELPHDAAQRAGPKGLQPLKHTIVLSFWEPVKPENATKDFQGSWVPQTSYTGKQTRGDKGLTTVSSSSLH